MKNSTAGRWVRRAVRPTQQTGRVPARSCASGGTARRKDRSHRAACDTRESIAGRNQCLVSRRQMFPSPGDDRRVRRCVSGRRPLPWCRFGPMPRRLAQVCRHPPEKSAMTAGTLGLLPGAQDRSRYTLRSSLLPICCRLERN